MKAIDMMKSGENVGYCIPYATPDDKLWVICGVDFVAIKDGDTVIDAATPEQIAAYARRVNPDYDEYDGHTDLKILIDGIEGQYYRGSAAERGCDECPFRDVCEAVNADVHAYTVYVCGGADDGKTIAEYATEREAVEAAEKWIAENGVDEDEEHDGITAGIAAPDGKDVFF